MSQRIETHLVRGLLVSSQEFRLDLVESTPARILGRGSLQFHDFLGLRDP